MLYEVITIQHFYVMEHDNRVIGCAALHPYIAEKMAEFACSRPRLQRRHRRKGLALEQLEERPGRGRDVVDALRHPEPVDRGDGVAAAGDGESARRRDGARERLGAPREGVVLV